MIARTQGLRDIGHEFRPPTSYNFRLNPCKELRGMGAISRKNMERLCYGFIAAGASGLVGYLAEVLFGGGSHPSARITRHDFQPTNSTERASTVVLPVRRHWYRRPENHVGVALPRFVSV